MPAEAEVIDTKDQDYRERVALCDLRDTLDQLQGILWPLQHEDLDNPLVDRETGNLTDKGFWRLHSAAKDVQALYDHFEPLTGPVTSRQVGNLTNRGCAILAAFALALKNMAEDPGGEIGIIEIMYFYDATLELQGHVVDTLDELEVAS